MKVERQQLTDLLRSRGGERTAERAAQSLPQTIDLVRDRDLLRQCGIDPNALAAMLPQRTLIDGSATDSIAGPHSSATAGGITGPADLCPRCQLSFSSMDSMLDHLNSHLREPRAGTTEPVLEGTTLSMRQLDDALDGLERALRMPEQRHRPRLSPTAFFLILLFIAGGVLVFVVNPPVGLAVIALSLVLSAANRTMRRRESARGYGWWRRA